MMPSDSPKRAPTNAVLAALAALHARANELAAEGVTHMTLDGQPAAAPSEQRSVTLSREQRRLLGVVAEQEYEPDLQAICDDWDAADPLPCHACNGTGRQPSYEGCGTTVICDACNGTGLA